jgi:hypothetical protein
VLHSIWGGSPESIHGSSELAAIADLRTFVDSHVRTVLREEVPLGVRERMPRRYLELEETRLIDLVTEWLEFERTRVPFVVARAELDVIRAIAGLTLKLRLDRVDRLNDGSFLVIDYKTGDVSADSWELPRPEDVQLPLYATFGLNEDLRAQLAGEAGEAAAAGTPGGLVFGKVRTGEPCFEGRVRDARAALLPGLGSGAKLARKKLRDEDLDAWKLYIERMAREFVAGCADVNPRDPDKTCEKCGLQTLCRIQEVRESEDANEDAESGEAGDE